MVASPDAPLLLGHKLTGLRNLSVKHAQCEKTNDTAAHCASRPPALIASDQPIRPVASNDHRTSASSQSSNPSPRRDTGRRHRGFSIAPRLIIWEKRRALSWHQSSPSLSSPSPFP